MVQGSTLVPTFFLFYKNNLIKINNIEDKSFLFADDTAILFVGDSWKKEQTNPTIEGIINSGKQVLPKHINP